MWGWVTDLRVLRHAWQRVASNRGRRTAGIDGMTVGRIRNGIGEQRFLEGLQAELRSGAYRPSPAPRKLIPKAGKPGQFRPLGIPTVKDRVVAGETGSSSAPATLLIFSMPLPCFYRSPVGLHDPGATALGR
ncbi:hypothetical protein X727_32460 [Mesorhizobium sp. L103C119B0]|nr:hypothetical protein X727_32460 [Mesorhizobium sp. L103C119B0]